MNTDLIQRTRLAAELNKLFPILTQELILEEIKTVERLQFLIDQAKAFKSGIKSEIAKYRTGSALDLESMAIEDAAIKQDSGIIRYLKVLKGIHGQQCNRTACQNSPATFYNQSTKKYYCPSCAENINNLNRVEAFELYKSDLCLHTDKEEFKERWSQLNDKDKYLTAYAHVTAFADDFLTEEAVRHMRKIFDLGDPMVFISEDRRRYRIAAESVDVMKLLIKTYIVEI
jgi:hypothetical protein